MIKIQLKPSGFKLFLLNALSNRKYLPNLISYFNRQLLTVSIEFYCRFKNCFYHKK